MTSDDPEHPVVLVVDPAFGSRLDSIVTECPVWIVQSPVNLPVIEAIWERSGASPASELTCFIRGSADSDVDVLLAAIDDLQLHHGPYSSGGPFRSLVVIGAAAGVEARDLLGALGFEQVVETAEGFVASRRRGAP